MYSVEIKCSVCQKKKTKWVAAGIINDMICDECEKEATQKKKRDYLVKLQRMSHNQRLALIEERIYDCTPQEKCRCQVVFK